MDRVVMGHVGNRFLHGSVVGGERSGEAGESEEEDSDGVLDHDKILPHDCDSFTSNLITRK